MTLAIYIRCALAQANQFASRSQSGDPESAALVGLAEALRDYDGTFGQPLSVYCHYVVYDHLRKDRDRGRIVKINRRRSEQLGGGKLTAKDLLPEEKAPVSLDLLRKSGEGDSLSDYVGWVDPRYAQVDAARTLAVLLAQIPVDQARAVWMRKVLEYPLNEIAAREGRHQTIISKRIRRGMAGLRELARKTPCSCAGETHPDGATSIR